MNLKIKIFPFIVVVMALALFIRLGFWQVDRYSEKLEMESQYNTNSQILITQDLISGGPSLLNYQNVELSGHWVDDDGFFLNLKKHYSKSGLHVVTPLLLDSGSKVMVNRGWIEHSPENKDDPIFKTTDNKISIKGFIRKMSNPYFMTNVSGSKRKMFVDIEKLKSNDSSLLSVVVFQTSNTNDGLIRDWQSPEFKPTMHLGYAIMWFAFALILLISSLYIQFKQEDE